MVVFLPLKVEDLILASRARKAEAAAQKVSEPDRTPSTA
jgi:hypothetical protein